MMKKTVFVSCIFLCLYFGCKSQNEKTDADVQGSLELIVEPGEQWLGKMKVLFFSVKKAPQMAAWIEDEDGRFITTITVTNSSANEKWKSAPKEGRPEALPVWNHRQKTNPASVDMDAVSTATPKSSGSDSIEAKIDKGSLTDGNTYSVFFEINHSFDYNDYWTENNSGVNGQPSLIYHAQFIAGQPGSISLAPIGHGSVDGSNGNITGDPGSITSALNIVKGVSLIGR
jgi:hypothetical protein